MSSHRSRNRWDLNQTQGCCCCCCWGRQALLLGVAILSTRSTDLPWQVRAVRVLPVFALPAVVTLIYSGCASYNRMSEFSSSSRPPPFLGVFPESMSPALFFLSWWGFSSVGPLVSVWDLPIFLRVCVPIIFHPSSRSVIFFSFLKRRLV